MNDKHKFTSEETDQSAGSKINDRRKRREGKGKVIQEDILEGWKGGRGARRRTKRGARERSSERRKGCESREEKTRLRWVSVGCLRCGRT